MGWRLRAVLGRALAILVACRRLRVDDEMSHETSCQMTILASVFMVGMRLERMPR